MKLTQAMRVLTLFCMFLVLMTSDARRRTRRHKHKRELRVKDCGTDPDRPIHIQDLVVSPMPVTIPGKVRVWTTLNITEDLPPHMGVNMYVKKHGFSLPLPCGNYRNYCHYKDICSIMRAYYTEKCPKVLRKQGLQCSCPIQAGVYRVDKLRFPLPDVPDVYKRYLEGKYDLKLQIFDETNKRELGCVQLRFYVEERRTSKFSSLFPINS